MTLAHNPRIVTDGLVLCLDAANPKSYPGSGATWSDLSKNGNNGALVNGVGYSSDNKGVMVFDGVNDYVINQQTSNLPIGNSSRTIEVWIKPYSETNNIVQIGDGGYQTGKQIYILEYYKFGSTVYLYTDGINSQNNLQISNDQIPVLNQWNHIVFGNSNQSYFYYLNGTLKKSGTWSVTLNTIGQQYVIGKRLDYASDTSNSNISNVKIYNRALAESEIKQNYNALKGRYGL